MEEAAAIPNPEQRLNAQLSIADVLWRMGDSENARKCVEDARNTAPKVADPTRRSQLTALLDQTAEYVKSDPPNRLSATPTPRRRSEPKPSNLPPFPITPDGFGTHSSTRGTTQINADSELITELYGRVAARDREGLIRIVDNAATPFQKSLALASVEHLLIQEGKPEIAESYAAGIPESSAECVLAKAEALNSVGAEWLRKGDVERARSDFESALKLAKTPQELPLGAEESLNIAEQVAMKLPIFNPATRGKEPHPVRQRYRNEAYQEILAASVQTNNLAFARHVADLWKAMGSGSGVGVIGAWLGAGRPDEAIAFAAGIENVAERVKTQLFLAMQLLDEAGAPNI
jgi:tetratricopeptide (TPR) repeat protein